MNMTNGLNLKQTRRALGIDNPSISSVEWWLSVLGKKGSLWKRSSKDGRVATPLVGERDEKEEALLRFHFCWGLGCVATLTLSDCCRRETERDPYPTIIITVSTPYQRSDSLDFIPCSVK